MEAQKTFSKAEKRWLVRELSNGRMTHGEAKELLAPISNNPRALIYLWQKQFTCDIDFTLPVMTEKEKQKVEALRLQLKTAEKQLEDAQMKNIALETMIDLAEEQLKISIRKKSGPKQ